MNSISSLFKFSLCISVAGLQNAESLLLLSDQNPDNSLIFYIVHIFVYFLVPLTFTLATLLLHFHLTISNTKYPIPAFFLNILTVLTRAMAGATFLVGCALMAISSLPSDRGMDPAIWAGVACIGTILVCNSLKDYVKNPGTVHQAPPLFALCISLTSLLLVDPLLSYTNQHPYNPLIHIPIHHLTYLQIPTFFLATALLLIQIAMPGLSVEHLDRAVQTLVFTTLLTFLYTMVYLVVAYMAANSDGGGPIEIAEFGIEN